MTVFLFIRHGQTAAVGRRLVGRSPGVPLTGRGRRQARLLSRRLAGMPIKHVFSSPMERAVETAGPLAEALNLPVEVDEGFQEVDFGRWTGLEMDEVSADERWRLYHRFRSGVRVPGGEMAPEIQTRMVAATERLRRAYPDDGIAVVSHGDPIRYVLAYYAGIPLDLALRMEVEVASVSLMELNDEGARIGFTNCTGERRD